MKLAYLGIALLIGFGSASCQQQKRLEKADLKTQQDKVSYSIGMSIAKNITMQKLELNEQALLQGISDGIKGDSTAMLLTEKEMTDVMMAFRDQMMAKQQLEMKAKGDKNKAESEKFLSENKAKPGVVTTKSGLQYKVLSSGNGPSPAATDKVKVDYEGKLIDGTVFDSSIKRGQPAEFPVNGVIPGWTEALQLMHVGDEWELYIPSELAYGENGTGANGPIGPNQALIFKVKLLSIEK